MMESREGTVERLTVDGATEIERLRVALMEAADALDHASRHADGWVSVAYEKARDKALDVAALNAALEAVSSTRRENVDGD